MTKYLIAALVVLAASFGVYLWAQEGYSQARAATQKAEEVATQLRDTKTALRAAELNAKLATKRLATAEAQRTAALRREKELSDALKDNPDWAAQPVPDSVWDALGPQAGKAAP